MELCDVEVPIFPKQLAHSYLPGTKTCTHFCYRLSRHQGHSVAGGLDPEKSNNLIGNRTHGVPPCSIVPEPTTLPRSPRQALDFAYY
jgi:hypothetical protein